MLKKIQKRTARKLFNQGKVIRILPCNVRLDNKWLQPMEIANWYSGIVWDFDWLINSYEHYQCIHELGRYCHYFIEE